MSSKLFSRSPQNSSSPSRTAIARALCASLVSFSVLVAVLSAATSVQAASVDVFFDGNRPTSDPTTAFGISLASATNAASFGVPILTTVDLLTTITNRVSATIPDSSTLVLDPTRPTGSQNTAISNWQVENISGARIAGASYLLFTHTDPYEVGNTTIDYTDENVGLRIDAEDGWVIIRGRSQGIDYYYPALMLDPTDLSVGERVTASIHYVVNEALTGIRKNGRTNYYLPELQLGFALAVIPEPGTALLLGFGLTILAAQRKRA